MYEDAAAFDDLLMETDVNHHEHHKAIPAVNDLNIAARVPWSIFNQSPLKSMYHINNQLWRISCDVLEYASYTKTYDDKPDIELSDEINEAFLFSKIGLTFGFFFGGMTGSTTALAEYQKDNVLTLYSSKFNAFRDGQYYMLAGGLKSGFRDSIFLGSIVAGLTFGPIAVNRIRNRDDVWNYIVSGCTMGALRCFTANMKVGIFSSVVAGSCSALYYSGLCFVRYIGQPYIDEEREQERIAKEELLLKKREINVMCLENMFKDLVEDSISEKTKINYMSNRPEET